MEENYLSKNGLRGEYDLFLIYIDFTTSYLKEYKLRCEDYMDNSTPFFMHTTESDDYNKGIMYFYNDVEDFISLDTTNRIYINYKSLYACCKRSFMTDSKSLDIRLSYPIFFKNCKDGNGSIIKLILEKTVNKSEYFMCMQIGDDKLEQYKHSQYKYLVESYVNKNIDTLIYLLL